MNVETLLKVLDTEEKLDYCKSIFMENDIRYEFYNEVPQDICRYLQEFIADMHSQAMVAILEGMNDEVKNFEESKIILSQRIPNAILNLVNDTVKAYKDTINESL